MRVLFGRAAFAFGLMWLLASHGIGSENPPILAKVSPDDPPGTCTHLLGSGTAIRVAIVPAGFDGADPTDVAKFEELSAVIASGFGSVEPYASNLDRFSVSRANDYRGVDVIDPWYNADLIAAAGVCDWSQIVVIMHNSGWAGGAPGFFSVVGSGTPPTCNPTTCTGEGCPWTPTCSWDYNIAYTALHETGHTFAGLNHPCPDAYLALRLLEEMEVVSVGTLLLEGPKGCSAQPSVNPKVPCMDWSEPAYLNWMLPADPHFGCFPGCGEGYYVPWQANNIMCIDFDLENGYTPVDRAFLAEVIDAPEPPCRTLVTAVDPAEGGSVSVSPGPNCTERGQYLPSTAVTLTAQPEPGLFFSRWEGGVRTCHSPVQFTMDSGRVVLGMFSITPAVCGYDVYIPLVLDN